MVRVISTRGSFFTISMVLAKRIPSTVPVIIPPINTMKNSIIPLVIVDPEKLPRSTTPRIILNTTRAVPSLKRLSPSTSRFSRFGAPISLNRATTATGSVADMREPNRRDTPRGRPRT